MNPRRKSALTVAALAIWFLAAGLFHYNHTDLAGDAAEYVNNPLRLLDGELPYRDFWLLHPPGEVLLPAAIYALGFGVNALLLVNVWICVGVGLAAYQVARLVSGSDTTGALAGILVFFSGEPVHYSGYTYLHAYLLCLLVAAGFLVVYLKSHRRLPLFVSGVAMGLALCFRFYLAGAAAAAIFGTVALEARSRRCGLKETVRLLAAWTAGALIVPAVVSACLPDIWPAMFHAVVWDSVSHATVVRPVYGYNIALFWPELRGTLFRFVQQPTMWTLYFATTAASSYVEILVMHLLPGFVGLLWFLDRKRRGLAKDPVDWSMLFFLVWGGLTFARGFSRGGSMHALSQSVTPLYFALVLLLRPTLERWWKTRAFGSALAAGCAILMLVGTGQRAAVTTVQKYAAMRHKVSTITAPYGTLELDDDEHGAELQSLLATVIDNTAEGDYLFVTPFDAPPIYALTRRRNPTPYDSVSDLIYRPAESKQRAVCQALLAKETRLVIHQPQWCYSGHPTLKCFEDACPLINACIHEHFEPVQNIGRFVIYRSKIHSGEVFTTPGKVQSAGSKVASLRLI